LIDGVREIDRAIQCGVSISDVFVSSELAASDKLLPLQARIEGLGACLHEVAPEAFGRLAYGDRTEGIVAIADMVERSIESLELPAKPIVAVLDGIEKPGNLGAIARSADATGVAAIVVVGRGSDLFNPNAIRASLGAVFALPIVKTDGQTALEWTRARGLPILAATPEAKTLYTDVDLASGAAIVLGSEAHGVGAAWRKADVIPIRLPMCGIGDSLNVSSTAAILFYEALRQRAIFAQGARADEGTP
jgi:TrmH family RNA methyltransferase